MRTDQPPRPGRVAQSDHLLTPSRQIPARDGQRTSALHTRLSAPDSQTADSLARCGNALFKVVGFSRRSGLQRRARCSHSPDIAIRRLCGRSAAGLTACAVRLTFQGARILNGAASGHSVSALIAGGAAVVPPSPPCAPHRGWQGQLAIESSPLATGGHGVWVAEEPQCGYGPELIAAPSAGGAEL
jgi:hypothetical protein